MVGLFRLNLVSSLFGEGSILSRVIFVVVGLAGLYCISLLFRSTTHASIPAREIRRAAYDLHIEGCSLGSLLYFQDTFSSNTRATLTRLQVHVGIGGRCLFWVCGT
jgi:hypothetical protein